MDFANSMAIAATGRRAQSDRMKVIAENIANANSTSSTPGGDPYRRKIATQTSSFDRELGVNTVKAGNPNPHKQGYIKLPNVDPLIEIMDMKEAQRSYEADLTVMDATKQMQSQAVDFL